MNYLISHYGAGIAVGLIQEQGAQEEINLAHNLFDSTIHDSIFHGTILFDTVKQFRRFLAYKAFFNLRPHGVDNEFPFWKAAFREAKRVMQENCRQNNFMFQMTAANGRHHGVGGYQDETDDES